MQVQVLASVALGGALGALGRYLMIAQVSHWFGPWIGGFPLGTLSVNVLGSFVMGLLVEVMAITWSPSAELRALLTIGFLGAFTTFSTFSLEAFLLYERGAVFQAAGYVAASVVFSIAGFAAGLYLVRISVG
ncbi:fluoride efflux transporter CrcB [Pelagibius litoralis]|uniref:Fluoride-specific ion channel FluC n=1 Tax=Pelagibius litoralis TaxID=374515 RepID=A0A967KEV7_9PROT|nr:fluoride efflux transporter CrcB [Pelagibius litoralis]NIA72119.1 fluoride efflux transporter CrcB [Pelagibius litoralis]